MKKSKFIYCAICENNLFHEVFNFNYKTKLECNKCDYSFIYKGIFTENITKVYLNAEGKFHRLKGPAQVFANHDALWFQNGVLHREDGPAMISNQFKSKAWYWYGKFVGQSPVFSDEDFEKWKKVRAFL